MFSLNKTLLLLMMSMVILCFTMFAHAQLPTDVDKFLLNVGIDKIVDDSGWNVLGAVPYEVGSIDGYAAGILQSGNFIRGKYHAEANVPIGDWAFTVFGFGTARGNKVDDLGFETNFGVGIDTPAINNASLRIGIFGRNAGDFGSPSAYDVLEDNQFSPDDIDGLGLENISKAPTGLKPKVGNALNALLQTKFNYKGVDFAVTGLPELTGEGDPAHQLLVSANITRPIGSHVQLSLGIERAIQWWNRETSQESAWFFGAGISY